MREIYKSLWPGAVIMSIRKLPFLPYLETHLSDACNLNCKGCSHFSPLCRNASFPDKASLLADLKQLTQLFGGIGHLRLLGGEPLLNPELITILGEIRDALPTTRLTLVTNGLLLKQWGFPLMQKLKETNTALCITGYPINQKIGLRAVAAYRANGNLAMLTPNTAYFRLFIRDFGKNGWENCELRHCILLREGHLYRCSISAMIFAYNRAFNQTYPEEVGVNLDSVPDGHAVLALLNRPGKMCRYCSDCGILRKWEHSQIHTPEEWRADMTREE